MDNNLNIFITFAQVIVAAVVAFATASYKFGKIEQRTSHLEEDSKDEKKEVRELGKTVSEVKGQLSVNNPALYVQRRSPVTINERGEKLFHESRADKFLENNNDELLEKVKTAGYQTAYDIQENSRIVINGYRNDERFVPLKDYAFKQGIDLELISFVLSLKLRDLALASCGFSLADVDKNDPHRESGKSDH